MKNWIFLLLIINLSTNTIAVAGDDCQSQLDSALLQSVSEDVIYETILDGTELTRVSFLMGLVIPQAYRESEIEFEKRRASALKTILPLARKLQHDMSLIGETFPEKLSRLATTYDKTNEVNEKAAVMYQILQMFRISNESYYIALLRDGPHSVQFKQTLARALRRIFKTDPSWNAPLNHAMAKAGVPF